jgi:hypothetical protein
MHINHVYFENRSFGRLGSHLRAGVPPVKESDVAAIAKPNINEMIMLGCVSLQRHLRQRGKPTQRSISFKKLACST